MSTWDYIAIVSAVLFVWGTYLDFSSSLKQPYYGVGEGNKFLDDKYGLFNLKKALLIYGIWFALGIAWWFYTPFAAAAWFLMAAAKGIILGLNNRKQFRYYRNEKQIPFLLRLRATIAEGSDTSYVFASLGPPKPRHGFLYYQLFRWITIPTREATIATDTYDLRRKIEDLSQRPESEWFEK